MSILTDFSTFTFTVNRDDIIRLAMTDAGVLGVGEDIAAEDLTYCADKLNMLVKQWQGNSDFAPGLKMWARKRADLFLQIGKIAYNLGPSGGDKWVRSGYWESTTTTVLAAAAATTITVADPSNILTGTKLGITLNSGATHWTSANGAPAGAVVTLLAAMPSAAASGSRVYIYEQATTRPLQILSARLRGSDNQDGRPLTSLTLDEYQNLPSTADTNAKGNPLAYYYEAQLGNGVFYLDRYPVDVVRYPFLHVVYLSPIEDLTESTDTPDYPQNWYRALAAQLAMDIAPGFQIPASKELIALRNDAVLIARNHDPDMTRAYFQPYLDDTNWTEM